MTTRILVSGTRDGVRMEIITSAINYVLNNYSGNFILIEGCSNGVDKQTKHYCKSLGWTIESFPPEWNKYGKYAGIGRNQDMVNSAPDFGIFIPSLTSKGTYDCLNRYQMLNKPYILYDPKEEKFTIFS